MQNLFIALTLLCYHRGPRWSWLMFLCLGTAVATKYLAVVMLPFLVTRDNRRWLLCAAFPLLSFIPFAAPGMFQSTRVTGSNEPPPQFAPPFVPGNITVGCSPTGW